MIYRFGDCLLDTERLELLLGEEPVEVEPQVFTLLTYLLQNRDRVVSKDEIIEDVWKGRIVSDGTLNSRINSVRRAVGDTGDAQAVIKTFPRRGFRFVADVSDQLNALEQPVAASPSLDELSIAVLPFVNLSGDPEQEYFADGLTEDIITALSKISELHVIARNSSFIYKGRAVKVSEVAQDLRVAYVLEGSVRSTNNRVRVTAQLIEAKSELHIWAEKYDEEVSDLFALQDEITNKIVVALQVNLSEGDQARLRRRQTDNLEAWECFVRGSRDATSGAQAKNDRALELLEHAVSLDPNFAVAWVQLGRSHWQVARGHWTNTPKKSFDKAIECAEKALTIDDTLPDTHAFIGIVRLFQRRFADAITAGEKAVELGPNSAETYVILAQTLNYVGRAADALALIERAMRLFRYHPDNMLGVLALSYRMLGRYEEAIGCDTERLERNPDNMYSDFRLASVYMELGQEDKARRHAAEAIKKNPNCSLRQVRFSEPYQDEQYLSHHLDLLRQAGLPE